MYIYIYMKHYHREHMSQIFSQQRALATQLRTPPLLLEGPLPQSRPSWKPLRLSLNHDCNFSPMWFLSARASCNTEVTLATEPPGRFHGMSISVDLITCQFLF